ncbi:hypothetical protein QJS10_CPB20g00482 [Acorus calamus]|uniref:Uncharacterized protein n=1 Tax=Acorus calamus TaxID=4465 RepID=A0AAV9CBS2_ACOCL|nr:hypothetical protein QJS10_CPB20g00482 [Acorus calamus]
MEINNEPLLEKNKSNPRKMKRLCVFELLDTQTPMPSAPNGGGSGWAGGSSLEQGSGKRDH